MGSPWKSQSFLQVIGKIPLGQGDFGKVWKAYNCLENCEYAVKQVYVGETLKQYKGDTAKLLREVRNLLKVVQVKSDHVVSYKNCWPEGNLVKGLITQSKEDLDELVAAYDESDYSGPITQRDFLYIQMELCDLNLSQWIDEHPTIESRKSSGASYPFGPLLQLAKGLNVLHECDIIHRDLKAANIFLKRKNGSGKEEWDWKIGDLGLSKEFVAGESDSTATAGTKAYWPSEVYEGISQTTKSDVFSLGLIFIEILYPFGEGSSLLKRDEVFFNLRERHWLPNEVKSVIEFAFPITGEKVLEIVVNRMLRKHPGERDDCKTIQDLLEFETAKSQGYWRIGQSEKNTLLLNIRRSNSVPNILFQVQDQPSRVPSSITSSVDPSASLRTPRPILFSTRPPMEHVDVCRTKELQKLNELMLSERQESVEKMRNVLVIGGKGGVGKTELVRKFCYQFTERFYGTADIIWLNATSALTLHASFKSMFKSKLEKQWNLDELGKNLQAFYDTFNNAGVKTTKSLIVLDNADLLMRGRESLHPEAFEYLPHYQKFFTNSYIIPYFIITTRNHNHLYKLETFDLDRLEKKSAIDFMALCLTSRTQADDDYQIIYNAYGGIPLAIHMAVLTLLEIRRTTPSYPVTQYVSLINDAKTQIQQKAREIFSGCLLETDEFCFLPVVSCFVAMHHISINCERAFQILRLLTILSSSDTIEWSLIISLLKNQEESPSDWNDALLELERLDLVTTYARGDITFCSVKRFAVTKVLKHFKFKDCDLSDERVLAKLTSTFFNYYGKYSPERLMDLHGLDRSVGSIDLCEFIPQHVRNIVTSANVISFCKSTLYLKFHPQFLIEKDAFRIPLCHRGWIKYDTIEVQDFDRTGILSCYLCAITNDSMIPRESISTVVNSYKSSFCRKDGFKVTDFQEGGKVLKTLYETCVLLKRHDFIQMCHYELARHFLSASAQEKANFEAEESRRWVTHPYGLPTSELRDKGNIPHSGILWQDAEFAIRSHLALVQELDEKENLEDDKQAILNQKTEAMINTVDAFLHGSFYKSLEKIRMEDHVKEACRFLFYQMRDSQKNEEIKSGMWLNNDMYGQLLVRLLSRKVYRTKEEVQEVRSINRIMHSSNTRV